MIFIFFLHRSFCQAGTLQKKPFKTLANRLQGSQKRATTFKGKTSWLALKESLSISILLEYCHNLSSLGKLSKDIETYILTQFEKSLKQKGWLIKSSLSLPSCQWLKVSRQKTGGFLFVFLQWDKTGDTGGISRIIYCYFFIDSLS